MHPQINLQLIRNLEKLGLTENEAKTYVGLVSLGEATASAIHEVTNVPRSKVYEILNALAKKGYLEVRQGSPTYFRAVDPKNVIEEIRDDFLNCSIDTLNQFKELNYELPKNSPVWYIQSDRVLKTRIREIIDGIREELIIYSTNPEFLKELEPEINKVEKIYSVKLIVDKLDKFTSMSLDFRETSKKFTSFMNKIAIDGVQYKEEFFMIADGKVSITVYRPGNKREGLIINLPMVAYLQKSIYERLIEPSYIIEDR